MTTDTLPQGTLNGSTRPDTLFQTHDDGGDAPVEEQELARFKTELDYLSGENARDVAWRRQWADDIRFCRWTGQAPDGLKHRENLNGKEPFPFEGARDARVRSADALVTEHVLVLMAAALGASIQVKPMEIKDGQWAGRMNTLLRWVLFNRLGADFVREMWRLAQYQEGDSPGAAVLGCWWRREIGLRNQTVTLEDFVVEAARVSGVGPEDATAFAERMAELLSDPKNDAGMEDWVRAIYPHIKPAKARKVLKEFRDRREASFPVTYIRANEPVLCAYRVFQDIFVPFNTSQPRRARMYFIREWLSEVDLTERKFAQGYSEEFVDELLKHEGKTGLPLFERNAVGTESEPNLQFMPHAPDQHRGEYEVITAVFRAVNEDDVPGIYTVPFSKFVDVAARPRQLLDFAHGEYPFTWFSREILTNRVIDSRGVPELEQTDQQIEKFIFDSFSDNASLSALPMIEVPHGRSKLELVIGPLKPVRVDQPGQVRWMETPQYPAAVEKLLLLLRERRDNFWGRISPTVPPALTQLHQQGRITLFLASLKDALKQLLQLCQQYLSDEELARITGADNMPIARNVEEIQGQFDLDLSFSAIGLDPEMLVKLTEVMGRFILPMDKTSNIDTAPLVRWLTSAFNANLAEAVWRPTEQATANEQLDEDKNMSLMRAGVEPPMMKDGQNWAARLQRLEENVQRNPDLLKDWPQKSREMLEARMEHLRNQMQQQANAVIGARVGKSVLGG